jgi:hypothetical protein
MNIEALRPPRQDGTGTPGPFDRAHGPEYIEWASREGNIVLIVPLNPAYKAGLRGTCRSTQPRRVLMIPRKYFGKGSKDVR